MNVAYLHLRQSEFKQSLEYLDRAKRVAPENADVYKLEGWAYYGMNRPDQAVAEWKKSLALRPDADTQRHWIKRSATKPRKKITRKMKARIFS